MLILSFLNKIGKIIYIIFALTFLSIISSDHLLASNHILAVEELEITKEIDLKFSRNKIIEDAFKKAFYRLVGQILNSSDIKKLKDVDMREIKNLVENFKIKNEIFRDNKYYANFDVYFSKKKIKYFLEKKNFFYSSPKKISVLFLPIIIEKENLYLFNENIFYKYWTIDEDKNELINYIMPIEDIDEILKLISSQETLENLDIIDIAEKYNTENYILSLIYLDKKKLNFFSKIKFEKYKKNLNFTFYNVDIKDKDSVKVVIKEAKIQLYDVWKDFNEINTSVKLSLNLILNSNNPDKIYEFENILNKIDDIRSFSISKFDLNKTIYAVNYNTNPNKLINQFLINGFSIINEEGNWVVE